MASKGQVNLKGKKIAWLVPLVKPGSGGLQTVFRHVTHLQEVGAECHVIGCFFEASDNAHFMGEILLDAYQCEPAKIIDSGQSDEEYDVAIATLNTTFPYLFALKAKKRAYFVQDYEPYFDEVGNNSLNAQNTYRDDVSIVTIGRWLVHKLEVSHGLQVRHTNFGADRTLYHPTGAPKQRAVCAIVQPDKPRRCPKLVAETFELIHLIDPSIKLIAYGSNEHYPFKVPVENRGLITKQECNDLYNECMVGMCISATNPSRIPFEMMSAGLPVVDVWRDNTVWDFSNEATTLAAPNPAALATAIVSLINDPVRLEQYSTHGLEFMESRSGAVEQEDFARAIGQIIADEDSGDLSVSELYQAPPVTAFKEMRDLYDTLRAERAVRALTPPALTTSSRYIKIELDGVEDEDLAAGLYVMATAEDDPVLHQEYYEAFNNKPRSFMTQVDTHDFEPHTGLYRLRVCRKAIGGNPDLLLVERSVRVADDEAIPDDERYDGAVYQLTGDHSLEIAFGDTPFVKNVKTLIKYVLRPEMVQALKENVVRFR